MRKLGLSVLALLLLLGSPTSAQSPARCYGVQIEGNDRIEADRLLTILASELEQDRYALLLPVAYMGDCTFRLIDSPIFVSKPFTMRKGTPRASRAAYRRAVREFLAWRRIKVKSL